MVDDARQIEHLLYRYAELIDGGDYEALADLFAHGRIGAGASPEPDAFIEGRDAVLAMYRSSTRLYDDNGTPHTKHVITNAIIDVDDGADRAAARSYFTVFQQTDELPLQPVIAGRYHDTFHRPDGEWCFDTRRMLVDLVGDLSKHLLFEL